MFLKAKLLPFAGVIRPQNALPSLWSWGRDYQDVSRFLGRRPSSSLLVAAAPSSPTPCCSRRMFSSWSGRGHDMLAESFRGGGRPKTLLEAIAPSGFDVSNLLKKIDPNEVAPHGALHMMGSILAFPNACFLWKIEHPTEITVESLAPVILHRPKIEFLFIGTAQPMDQIQLNQLKDDMKQKSDIVVEWLPLSEAMATFNILNGEDRMVATALVLDTDESNYEKFRRD